MEPFLILEMHMKFLQSQPQNLEPIELCHFECIDESVHEDPDLSFGNEYDSCYLSHIFSCYEKTGDSAALDLMANLGLKVTSDMAKAFDEFSDIDVTGYAWNNLEAWEELGIIYLKAGFPVYLSEEYFDIFPKNEKLQ